MDKFAVVIPFYQRDSGILIKAVHPILAQTLSANQIKIIIVDDASPSRARDELAHLADRITIIEQANSGPAAARNKGLNSVPGDVQFVAFLDSDDAWAPEHLENARIALGGNDFYFADHYQLGQTIGAFARAGRIDPSEHPAIGRSGNLHRYKGTCSARSLRAT
ncbi:MAG: glycosyltransferase family 2 protein [Massilia sp.]|jgi:succinoglycan biosynthesis protein ExoW|nr:glycosyltransferase family 2 protein [Massilia sp.]